MARPPSRPLQTTQDDLHLAALRRLVRGLEKCSVKIFESARPAASPHHVSTLIVALLNLAKRNLRPSCLDEGNGGGKILYELLLPLVSKGRSLSKSEQIIDQTAFAASCCRLLGPLACLDEVSCRTLSHAVVSLSNDDLLSRVAASAVSAGWSHEYLKQESLTPTQFLAPTQFFTPAWIAAMLSQQALDSGGAVKPKDFKLLDPACGAGHLLVPALTMLFEESLDRKEPVKALQNLLEHTVYGLDVDESLIDLARFALYLTARDIEDNQSGHAELPVPKLYALPAPLGTLALAIEPKEILFESSPELPFKLPVELPERFDAIVMNPPYLSTRTMEDTTRFFLRDHFSSASGDLYTAFIELGMRLLKDGGKISTVVQQSFLSISRYRQLRLSLLEEHNLLSSIILGTGAFPSRPGEKVNNAIITIEKRPSDLQVLHAKSLTFHRLADDKRLTLTKDEARRIVAQITGQPFAFHCPDELAKIFADHPAMADKTLGFDLTNGLFTCNNKLFVKDAAAVEAIESEAERSRFVPYDKGGGQKWFHQTSHRLNWGTNGEDIRTYRLERGQSRALPGEQFYFKPGVTYSYIGTKGFKARLLSEGSIFDIASSAIFSRRFDLHYLLGFLNSALAGYLLSLLNPTVNFQIGDLRKLPFKPPDPALEAEISALAAEAVALVKAGGREAKRLESIQARIDELIFDHYEVAEANRAAIYADPWVRR